MVLPNGLSAGALAGGFGAYEALSTGTQAATRSAEVDRAMLRSGITGDASDADITAGKATLRKLAADLSMRFDPVQKGLDSVVASGRSFGEALRMMPSIASTAQASGAEVEDIANSSTALLDHMGIKIEGLQRAQDALAAGGKLGKFELKDAARYLPSMLPAVKALGLKGQAGLEKVSAMLQVIREGTGTAEEAAASAANIFAKMESEETTNKFTKFGVDLRKEMEKARKEGKDLLTTFVELTNKATKGDLSKLPQLFTDMEFARGMRALVLGWEKVGKLQKQISNSAGTVAQDVARVTKDSQAQLDRLAEAKDRAMSSAGETLLSLASTQLENTIRELNAIADRLDRFTKTKNEKGLGAAIGEAAKQAAVEFMGSDYVFRTAPGGADQAQIERDTLRRQSDLRRAIHARQTQGYRGGPTEAQLQGELDNVDEVSRLIHQGRAANGKAYSATMARLLWLRNRAPLTAGKGKDAYATIAPGGSPGTGVGAFPLTKSMSPESRSGWQQPWRSPPRPVEAGPQAAGGKLEATVKPDQVVAKLDGSVPVTGEATVKHEFTINFNAGAFNTYLDGRISAQLSKIRLHTNGAGSTGRSSPDVD